jgi:large subunit ribosomal protein L25
VQRGSVAGAPHIGLAAIQRVVSTAREQDEEEGFSMAEIMNVAVRQACGTRAARKVRKAGRVPAVLYGHGKANVNLSIPTREVEAAIRHGAKLVDLRGEVSDTALIRAVQWDAFGVDVLHLDLTRVSAGDMVQVTVAVELRGEAPGGRAGGLVEQVVHEVEIECPAANIPDKFELNINSLELGASLTAGDLELPPGARLLGGQDEIIVHCVEALAEVEEEEAAPAEAGEPEVIGRKVEEEEEEGEG